jgi:glycosyltransferase involved in cell wall biosynthesis
MCSRDEGMGRVTVEAMSYGKPVIGFQSGATPELIEDGIDGFLYKNGAQDLAEKMELLLRDPNRASTMGKTGQQKAIQNYTVQKYVDEMYDVFREVYPF